MAIHYLIDGAYVRTLETAYSQGNHHKFIQWVNTNPRTRTVISVRNDEFYRLTATGWSTRGERVEPKEVRMARVVDAISETNWNEVQNEIQVDSFFTKR